MKHGSTAKTVKVATTAATDALAGILQNKPEDAEAANVAAIGICLAAAEASVTAGAFLTCSSTGRVKVTTTDLDQVIGKANEPSVSAGDVIEITLTLGTLSDS